MAASLIARSVTVTRGPTRVLDDVTITVAPGDRIGLVGPNGVGKSTLLAALAGRVPLDGGTVELAPADATVGLLAQEAERSPTETARAAITRRAGVTAAQHELDAASAALAGGDAGADERYSVALERWLSLGAADLDARIGQVLDELGLDAAVLDRPTASLSGGQAARCSLAALLVSSFDVVLLDEPTNDLDLDGLDRLERWVVGRRSPLVVVSHDRTFLERTITDVAEIDHHTRRVTRFGGGWAGYLHEREVARRHARERFEEYDGKRRSLLDRAQREREWATQGRAKVRRSDENDKHIRRFKIDQTEQLAGRAARTAKAIERLEVVDEPREPWELRLSIPTSARSGTRVCGAADAVVERGSFRLGPLDLEIGAGERVAITGPNGAGKTTLVELLLGRVAPDAGEAWLGSGVVVGEIGQRRDGLVADATVLDAVSSVTGDDVATTRTLLAKFGLRADHVLRRVDTLSPGERTRAALALLQARGANLLVFDEPTNHLDIEAIEQIEQALETYGGTLLLVTHDRALLDRVALTRRLAVEAGCIVRDDAVGSAV